MAKLDPEILAQLEWIGFVRPTGLVVSAPALVRAGAIFIAVKWTTPRATWPSSFRPAAWRSASAGSFEGKPRARA